MLKYVDTKICFQEVPDELSLCISLSGCPHRCKGCHSAYLQGDIGEWLTEKVTDKLIEDNYGITCVCFMGGDNDIPWLCYLAQHVKNKYGLKVAWYTGLEWHPKTIDRPTAEVFDFIKAGPYIEELGPLTSKTTNQRFYTKGIHIHKMDANDNMFYDTTSKFWKND